MDRTDLIRLRWRLSGAWLWPTFGVLTIVDALVGHWLPPIGDTQSTAGAWLVATVLMLLAVGLLSPPLAFGLRRLRGDLPRGVARNYAGTLAALFVSVCLTVGGIAHHATITNDRVALLDASERAKAWFGDHAPTPFMSSLNEMNTFPIQPPEVYRACIANHSVTHYYCAIVDRSKPFGTSVKYDGAEPNQLLSQGSQ